MSIARAIELEDAVENAGAQLIKEVRTLISRRQHANIMQHTSTVPTLIQFRCIVTTWNHSCSQPYAQRLRQLQHA